MSLTEKVTCPICGKVEEGQFIAPLNDERCTECRNKEIKEKEVKDGINKYE